MILVYTESINWESLGYKVDIVPFGKVYDRLCQPRRLNANFSVRPTQNSKIILAVMNLQYLNPDLWYPAEPLAPSTLPEWENAGMRTYSRIQAFFVSLARVPVVSGSICL